MSRIFITGMGVMSAIGNSVAENHSALTQGICGVKKEFNLFLTKYAGMLPFGQVNISSASLLEKLGITEPGVTRTTMLALQAFNEVVQDAQIPDSQLTQRQQPGGQDIRPVQSIASGDALSL